MPKVRAKILNFLKFQRTAFGITPCRPYESRVNTVARASKGEDMNGDEEEGVYRIRMGGGDDGGGVDD